MVWRQKKILVCVCGVYALFGGLVMVNHIVWAIKAFESL